MGDKKPQSNFVQDFLVGGFTAAIAKTATAPIERVKLVIQTQDANEEMKKKGLRYKGIMDCFFGIVKNDGASALWRGNFANVIRYFPTQALNFAFKDFYKRTFNPYNPKTDGIKFFIGNILSGGAAGATSLCVVYPLDFARTRLAADMGSGQDRQFKGPFDCISKIFKSDGLPGLYRGFGISVLGIMAYRGCYFGLYDTGKEIVLPKDANVFVKFVFAQFVTGTSGVFSYPFDTVRRRLMMMSGMKKSKGPVDESKIVHYKGTVDCFQKILANEGFQGFFKGALSNFFRGIGASLVLVGYDEIQKMVNNAKKH